MTKRKPKLTAKDKQALKQIAAGMRKRRKRTETFIPIGNGGGTPKPSSGGGGWHGQQSDYNSAMRVLNEGLARGVRPDPVGEIKITYTDQHRLYAPLTKLASCTAILAILWFLLGGTMPGAAPLPTTDYGTPDGITQRGPG